VDHEKIAGSADDPQARNDFALINRFDVNLSAGPGAASDNARPLAPVAFRNDWLIAQGLRADRCVVCTATGYSMEPLLFDGDLVLLDRTVSAVRDGQVYGVVDVEGDTRIKRIEKIYGGIVLRSDHPGSPTEARMGDDANRVRIIGRLVWSGHSHDAIKQTPARQLPRRSTFKHQWI
jgi:phage repressor protein C with HTH and peptisase S24 domain